MPKVSSWSVDSLVNLYSLSHNLLTFSLGSLEQSRPLYLITLVNSTHNLHYLPHNLHYLPYPFLFSFQFLIISSGKSFFLFLVTHILSDPDKSSINPHQEGIPSLLNEIIHKTSVSSILWFLESILLIL